MVVVVSTVPMVFEIPQLRGPFVLIDRKQFSLRAYCNDRTNISIYIYMIYIYIYSYKASMSTDYPGLVLPKTNLKQLILSGLRSRSSCASPWE